MYRFRPFFIALQFLTILPIRTDALPDDTETGNSLLYYPLIGLIIGIILATLAWFLNGTSTLLTSATVLSVWILITGALHLDGLADSADALVGGLGNRERTLSIMKDPYCGPAAVVTLVLILLIKFSALEQLIVNNSWDSIALAPILGRTLLVLLFLVTPYVRPNGIGSSIANHMPPHASKIVVISTLIVITAYIGLAAILLLVVIAGVFLLLRQLMQHRLGGTTGDTAGALVEVTETAALIMIVFMPH
jgi:adenosylcobinamide-GDP ribazoletransferase